MVEKRNSCLEMRLNEEQGENERIARELISREISKQFPYKCDCKKVYHTQEQVIRETQEAGAMDYSSFGLFHFLVNCNCKTTKTIELTYDKFQPYETYRIQLAFQNLGNEAIKQLIKEKEEGKKPEEMESAVYVNGVYKNGEAKAILTNPQSYEKDQETQIQLGINIFWTRYRDWINRKSQL